MDIAARIAEEISAKEWQVSAAVSLLDEGSTVPFIARYRKEATGGLDDSGLRALEERLRYLRELEERRETVLRSIREQGKLTPELETTIRAADTKTRLEDLYLPYRPKRRTKGQIAREAGLEPLARGLLENPGADPQKTAAEYVNAEKGVADAEAALDGARWILIEMFAEDPELAGSLREHVWETGRIRARVAAGKEERGAKFRDYFSFAERLKRIPSHRMLALLRGRKEKVLKLSLALEGEEDEGGGKNEDEDKGKEKDENEGKDEGAAEGGPPEKLGLPEGRIAGRFGVANRGRPADAWLLDAVRSAWKLKLRPRLETDVFARLRERAEEEAIRVFASNLHDLLLAAPAGSRPTIGLDPGLRTGVKVAVIDGTGKLVDHGTIHPHAPRNLWDESIAELAGWAERHAVELVAIGNGTASRETDRLVRDLMRKRPELGLKKLVVSEAGASVYSASELASKEFPDLDVSLRGAVSIARRLQDPLAELVKIEPRSIGVGQYQHDVNQTRLARALDAVVEDCVNAVGVDLNTASVPLLARVSGLNRSLAENIVGRREENGPFRRRTELLEVSRLGEKAFEQAAGFLRIRDGENPLDASAVHPEAYVVVERIASSTGRDVRELIGSRSLIAGLDPADFTDEKFGVPTVQDILRELEKPGRDPRPDFVTAEFAEGVEEMKDLQVGMTLEGVVTNVTNFGAFVDVGVHQDGLVHISRLAERFVRDPREIVKAGDVVKVKVLELDPERGRIGLTMRLREPRDGDAGPRRRRRRKGSGKTERPSAGPPERARRPGGPRRRPEKERPARRETTAFGRLLDETLAKAKENEKAKEKEKGQDRPKEEQR